MVQWFARALRQAVGRAAEDGGDRQASGAAHDDPSELPVRRGEILQGKYKILHELGRGGMGVVFAAHHELLDQMVAVKILLRDEAGTLGGHERLVREARAAARLRSEHVVRVMDVGRLENGTPFIVMEHLEGRDLAQMLEDGGPMHPSAVADYILQALDAMMDAHAHGIVHRDLKPSNLFLARRAGRADILKVVDFGIAKTLDLAERERTLTGSRAMLGSPCYMSPEQIGSPRSIDVRTDIWSIGVILYELLTGTLPFGGDTWGEMIAAVLGRDPEPYPPGVAANLPSGLDAVVRKCLRRERDERYASVEELAEALAPFGSGARASGRADGPRAELSTLPDLASPHVLTTPRTVIRASDASPGVATTALSDALAASATQEAPFSELSPTASTVGRRLRLSPRHWGIGTALLAVASVAGAVLFFHSSGQQDVATGVAARDPASPAAVDAATADVAVALPPSPESAAATRPVSPPATLPSGNAIPSARRSPKVARPPPRSVALPPGGRE